MNISNKSHRTSLPPASRFPNYSAFCLTAAAAFFILMISIGSIPGKAEALSAATHDKFLHLSAYFILGILFFGGIRGSLMRRMGYTLAAIALLGGMDETIQYFLPYRKSEWLDWIFNMCAATLSIVAGCAIEKAMHMHRNAAHLDKQLRRKADYTN